MSNRKKPSEQTNPTNPTNPSATEKQSSTTTLKKPSRQSSRCSITLSGKSSLLDEFIEYCEITGVRPSDALRKAAEAYLPKLKAMATAAAREDAL